jgi:hypothetical protein
LFCFTTILADVKIKISIIFFDMVPQPPDLNGSKKLVFEAYLQFLFANASMMTENGTFFQTKSASFALVPEIWSSWKHFFQ